MSDDAAGWNDPNFSRIRAADLPEEAVVSRQIRDTLAGIDETTSGDGLKVLKFYAVAPAILAWGQMQLEQQIIELRREIQRR